MKLNRLWPVARHALFASSSSSFDRRNRIGWFAYWVYKWAIRRVPAQAVRPSKCDSMTVKLLLDMGNHEQEFHVIKLPVDLLEYPDVLRARCLVFHLEMVAGEGSAATMREVFLSAVLDRNVPENRSNYGIPAYRRSLRGHCEAESQHTR